MDEAYSELSNRPPKTKTITHVVDILLKQCLTANELDYTTTLSHKVYTGTTGLELYNRFRPTWHQPKGLRNNTLLIGTDVPFHYH